MAAHSRPGHPARAGQAIRLERTDSEEPQSGFKVPASGQRSAGVVSGAVSYQTQTASARRSLIRWLLCGQQPALGLSDPARQLAGARQRRLLLLLLSKPSATTSVFLLPNQSRRLGKGFSRCARTARAAQWAQKRALRSATQTRRATIGAQWAQFQTKFPTRRRQFEPAFSINSKIQSTTSWAIKVRSCLADVAWSDN